MPSAKFSFDGLVHQRFGLPLYRSKVILAAFDVLGFAEAPITVAPAADSRGLACGVVPSDRDSSIRGGGGFGRASQKEPVRK